MNALGDYDRIELPPRFARDEYLNVIYAPRVDRKVQMNQFVFANSVAKPRVGSAIPVPRGPITTAAWRTSSRHKRLFCDRPAIMNSESSAGPKNTIGRSV